MTSAPMPGQRERRRAGLGGRGAGQRADHDPARLGLPPRVDDRAALAADVGVVPHPRLGVDRLTDRPEDAQARQIVLLRLLVAPLHHRADRRRGGVEDRHPVLLDDRPEAVVAREVRDALVHHHRGPVGQRAVDDVAVPGDPADVGGAPVHVGVRMEVEHVLVGERDLGQVAARRVHDALRLAGGARRVEQVQQVLGVERLRSTVGVGSRHQLVVPVVATLDHRDLVLAPLDDDDVLDRGGVGDGLVGRRLEREHRAPPPAAVGGDQHLGLGVVDAVGERLRREPAEHDAVRGADARAGEHRHGRLGDHRQVDVDPVAGLDAEPLQHVGEALDLGEQVGVGDRAGVARLTLEVDGDLVAAAGGDVAIEAVVGDVELAADEPLGVRQVPLADGVPLGVPVEQLARLLGPEPLVVLGRLVVHPRARDEGVALGRLGRREGPVLGGQGRDAGGRIGHGRT